MPEKWFLASKGKGYGPFSPSQLKQMVETGLADHDDLVWQSGDSESIPVSDMGTQPPLLPIKASRPSPPPLPVPSPQKASHPSNRIRWSVLSLAALLMLILGFGVVAQFREEPTAWKRIVGAVQDLRNKITGEDLVEKNREALAHREASLRQELQESNDRIDAASANGANGAEKSTSKTPLNDTAGSSEDSTALPVPVLSLTFDDDVVSRTDLASKGIRLVNGIKGKAASFDGKSSIQIPCTLPAGQSPRSLSAWIKNAGTSEVRNSHAIAYGKGGNGKRAWGIYHQQERWATYGWGNPKSTSAVVDSDWHHHCLTYDGTALVYWFDGLEVANVEQVLNTTSGPLVLGTDETGGTYFTFTGLIDEVAVYGVALTGQQVTRLANERSR